MKGVHWDSGMNIPDHTSGAFRCFDGWLSHFRFHNRSLSPIHVRIVYDEKKSPSGLCERDDDHSKLVELHALLILLSTSSEGIIHFRSQFYDWMKLIWGTFLGTNSAVVQQSALRVLCALLPLQHPVDASKVLVQETPEALGFYTLEDVFVQQVLRMIGFCLNKCPQRTLEASEAAVVPWALMLARGIHGNQFSLEVRDAELQLDLENDVERRYQSSKRQSLMLANELNQLLQRLFRNSNGTWRQSIIRVSSNITRNFSNSRDVEPEICGIQFGKHVLCFSTVKCVESVGCLYFLSGGFEFLRPGITVEVRGSRDIAQVLSLEYHASNSAQNFPETPSDTRYPPQIDTLAHIRMDNNPNILKRTDGLQNRNEKSWFEKVFGSNVDFPDTSSLYSKVNTDELMPVEISNANDGAYSNIIYDVAWDKCDHKAANGLVEKAAEVIPAIYLESDGDLISLNIGCSLLKILVQIAGTDSGVDELLAKPALIETITEIASRPDSNPKHDTLYSVEKRVSSLRREVYTALVDLGEEGEAELASAFEGKREVSSAQSASFNDEMTTGRRSFLLTPTEIMRLNDGNLSDGDEPVNENWDPAQGDEQDDDEDDEEDESLDDGDNDDDEDDAEENRAEFVEELMLMGFPEDWCVLALKQTENDIVNASAWIVDNLEYLSKLQSTLDKERDKGRDSPHFDEEEDDVVNTDDIPSGSTHVPSLSATVNTTKDAENDMDLREFENTLSILYARQIMATVLHQTSRELSQGRLLFSQYLQGYVELLHVLQGVTGFNVAPTPAAHMVASSSGDASESEGCLLLFDRKRTRSSLLSFADDNLSVSYSGNEVWKAACAVTSFSTGVHSWLVRIEKSSSPYLFVGVATRQANLDSFLGADDQSWGFIGDKALYYQRNRIRAYGETFTEGDCIGLRLDCEKGELSFSKNGVDLGVAFDNIVGSVSPAVAFYSRHQKISFVKDSCTGETNIPPTGELEDAGVEDCLIACELMANWVDKRPMRLLLRGRMARRIY
ncbi:hypothetical protein PInf_019692 [Phytophthora infestans]|nr:hypothetical protein PInf_019692 [Phytophthora infestans]